MKDPDVGNFNIILSFSAIQQFNIVFYAQSFTNCAGAGASLSSPTETTPNDKIATIEENSYIVACGISIQSQSTYVIGGSNAVLKSGGAAYTRQIGVQLSVGGLSAGLITVSVRAGSGIITNYYFEIKEAVAPPPTSTGNFFMLF